MGYSLWRNGQLLGEIVVPFPTTSPDTIAGMLLPTPAFTDIAPLLQTRLALLPHAPVIERRFTGPETPGASPLRQMTDEEARGLPVHAILEIRDPQGVVVPRDVISLDRFPIPPADSEGELPDACRALGIECTGWMVGAFAHQESR